MSRPLNPFDPFGFLSSDPLLFFRLGIDMMQAWQRAVLPMFVPPGRVEASTMLPTPWPFSGWMPRLGVRMTSVRAAESAKPPTEESAPGTTASLVDLIARKQGRAIPWLGCLQGAQVVHPVGGESSAVEAAPVDAPPLDGAVLDKVVRKARSPRVAAAKPVPEKTASRQRASASKSPRRKTSPDSR